MRALPKLLLWMVCLCLPSFAFSLRAPENRLLLFGAFDWTGSQSRADAISAFSYSKKLNPAWIAGAGVGYLPFRPFYFGLRYEQWFTSRNYSVTGTAIKDTLNYQTLGLEAGFAIQNPRVRFLLLGSVNYPLKLSISNTLGETYLSANAPLSYSARLMVAIRFSGLHSFFLEGGYRWASLKDLNSGNTPYINDGGPSGLDLSGLFAGVGILFEF